MKLLKQLLENTTMFVRERCGDQCTELKIFNQQKLL